MNTEQARFNMIEQQIRTWNVLDTSVLDLLAVLRREDFVPPTYKSLAFMDLEIPLPCGQSMLPPKTEARLLQELALHKHEKVLEVGAGSGYMAALLGHKAQQVVTLELHVELVALARANLHRAGIINVQVEQADGSKGWSEAHGGFDAIVLSGSVAAVPDTLLAQLKPAGRLVGIVGQEPVMRAVRITRTSEHGFSTVELFDTVAPALEHFPVAERFHF